MAKLSSVVVTSAVAVAVLIGGGFAVIPSYGQASSNTERYSEPFEFSGVPLCQSEEGEGFLISGTANFVVHTTTGKDGNLFVSILHLNYQGVKAVSMTSGNTATLAEADTSIAQASNNEFRITTEVHGTLATQGDEKNTIFQLVFHINFDENGEPTITADHVEIKCEE